jgi:hypothetical protein
VDGRAVRGTRHGSSDGQAVHLLAAARSAGRRRPRPASVDGKTNEITQFAPLPEPLELAGTVVTADALHTQREHAEFLVTRKHAHYIMIVKKNQPGLYAQLGNLPRRGIPPGQSQRNRGHGREEHRTLKAATVAAGLAFPYAARAIRVTRRTRPLSGGKCRTVTACAITSLPFGRPRPARRMDPRPLADRGPAPHPFSGVPGLLHDVAKRQLRRLSATHLWGVVLIVAAALTRVLAVQVGLCNTGCVIMAEFQAL